MAQKVVCCKRVYGARGCKVQECDWQKKELRQAGVSLRDYAKRGELGQAEFSPRALRGRS